MTVSFVILIVICLHQPIDPGQTSNPSFVDLIFDGISQDESYVI